MYNNTQKEEVDGEYFFRTKKDKKSEVGGRGHKRDRNRNKANDKKMQKSNK